MTLIGGDGGHYESVAVDNRNPDQPIFFLTEDFKQGALRRFEADGSGWDSLHTGGNTTFLRFLDDNKFEWTGDESLDRLKRTIQVPRVFRITMGSYTLYRKSYDVFSCLTWMQ